MKEEYILIAAVRHFEKIFLGHRHSDILTKKFLLKFKEKNKDFSELEQGFLTSKNRFVSRAEAYQIAVKARQIQAGETEILISEDLY